MDFYFGILSYSDLSYAFLSVFSRIRTEYGDLLCKSPYSVRMWENTTQKNSENGHFLRRGSGLRACLMSPIETLD